MSEYDLQEETIKERIKEENEGYEPEMYNFIQETVKDEQPTRKKFVGQLLKQCVTGIAFGLAAAVAFGAFYPITESWFTKQNQEQILIEEEPLEDENPEVPVPEEPSEEQTEAVKENLDIDSYIELNQALKKIAVQTSKSVVEVCAVSDEKRMLATAYDEQPGVTGLIFWETSAYLYIVCPDRGIEKEKNLTIIFPDTRRYTATVKKRDKNLGLAVLMVDIETISDSTKMQYEVATLGSSSTVEKGDILLSQGCQFGYAGGLAYGICSSVRNRVTRADGQFRVLTTDIPAAENGNSILFNTKGEVVALADQTITGGSSMNMVTGYAISDIKEIVQNLANGSNAPYIGIIGVEVTSELSEQKDMPKGLYVKAVEDDSPAMEAGIQSGDVIIELGDNEVGNLNTFYKAMLQKRTGDHVMVKALRRGKGGYEDITFEVVIGNKR